MEPSKQERESFFGACRKGDTEKVESLLTSYPSLVNTKDWLLGNIHFFIFSMKHKYLTLNKN